MLRCDGGQGSQRSRTAVSPQSHCFPEREHFLLLYSQGPKNNQAFELLALVPSPLQRIISCF